MLREEVLVEEKKSGNKSSSYTPILLADTAGILRRVARTRTGPLRQRDAERRRRRRVGPGDLFLEAART